jgi:hypothetical protein
VLGSEVVETDGPVTRHYRNVSDMGRIDDHVWFHLVPILPEPCSVDAHMHLSCTESVDIIYQLIEHPSSDCGVCCDYLGGGDMSNLHENEATLIDRKRTLAFRARLDGPRGLNFPSCPPGWQSPDLPSTPVNWYDYHIAAEPALLLQHLFPNPRDQRLRFHSESHTYYIDGVQTQGSVTGLVHRFCNSFDAEAVIAGMMRSKRWPRPGYLRAPHMETLGRLQMEPAADVLSLALSQARQWSKLFFADDDLSNLLL